MSNDAKQIREDVNHTDNLPIDPYTTNKSITFNTKEFPNPHIKDQTLKEVVPA